MHIRTLRQKLGEAGSRDRHSARRGLQDGGVAVTKRIFRSVFLASLVVLLAGLALVVGALYNYFSGQQARPSCARGGAPGRARRGGRTAWTTLKALSEPRGLRLTWIDSDGTVIYDTDADADVMENHAEREEFREALEYGSGEGRRAPPPSARRRCTTRSGFGRHGAAHERVALHGPDAADGHYPAACADTRSGPALSGWLASGFQSASSARSTPSTWTTPWRTRRTTSCARCSPAWSTSSGR